MKLKKVEYHKEKLSKERQPKIKFRFRLLLYALTLACSILSLTETMHSRLGSVPDMAIYVLAAGGFILSGYYLSYDLTIGIKTAVISVRRRYSLADRICRDYHYRTVLFTTAAFLVNVVYAVGNGIYGWFRQSAWLGTLAAYYFVLSVMRFGIVHYGWKEADIDMNRKLKLKELLIYRNTGILFLLNSIVLDGAVILLIHNEGGRIYPGTLIFAVAAYAFYKIIMSVVHMVKARRMKSPLLVAVRNIGYADALVSILSLQTAMLVSFNEGTLEPKVMNGISGAAVCMITSFIGIYMIYSYSKQKKIVHVGNEQCKKE